MSIKSLSVAIAFVVASLGSVAQAAPLLQYATSVIDKSSEYTTTDWSAAQVLGAPNTIAYGDIATSWAPGPKNGSLEYVTVGFNTAVYASGATVRETYGNGFVYQVDVLDMAGVLHMVWTGTDTSLAGTPVDFDISWAQTAYLVKGLKVYTNTDHDQNAWEEIDAIRLAGDAPAAVPEPGTMALVALGLAGFIKTRRRGAVRKTA